MCDAYSRPLSPIFSNMGYQQIWERLQPCVSQCIGEYSTSTEMQKESVSVLRRVTYIIRSTCSSLSVKPRDCFDTMRLFVQRTGYSYDSKLCLLVYMFDIASRQMIVCNDGAVLPNQANPANRARAPNECKVCNNSYREELEGIRARLDNLEKALCVYNMTQDDDGNECKEECKETAQDTTDDGDAGAGDTNSDNSEFIKQLLDLMNSSSDPKINKTGNNSAMFEQLLKHLTD